MKPDVERVLLALVQEMAEKLHQLPPGPERMMLLGLHMTLDVAAREISDGAAERLAEIRELGKLLTEGAALVDDVALHARLLGAAQVTEQACEDPRLAALDARLETLLMALIELQAWTETDEAARCGPLAGRCWDFLVRSNRRCVVASRPW